MQLYLLCRPDATQVVAQRIRDLIRSRYRAESVWDVPVPDTTVFAQQVENTVQQCNAVLVIIGPDWLRARSPRGLPWQGDPSDPVAIGLLAALRQKKLIVPLLVHGAAMPAAADLTPHFAALTLHQGVVLREDPLFLTDIQQVYAQLNTQLAWRPASTPLLLIVVGIMVSFVLAVVFNHKPFVGLHFVIGISAILLNFALSCSALIGAYVLAVQRKQPLWLAALIVLTAIGTLVVIGVVVGPIHSGALLAWQLLSAGVVALLALFSKRREMA